MAAAKIPDVVLVVCGILLVLSGLSSGQTTEECTERYQNASAALTNLDQFCDITEEYVECILRAMHAQTLLTDAFVTNFETSIEAALGPLQLDCPIEFEQIAAMIRNSSDSSNNTSSEYEICVNTYASSLNLSAPRAEVCAVTQELYICTFDAINLDLSTLTELQMDELQAQLNQTLSDSGISCDFTIRSIAAAQGAGVSDAPTQPSPTPTGPVDVTTDISGTGRVTDGPVPSAEPTHWSIPDWTTRTGGVTNWPSPLTKPTLEPGHIHDGATVTSSLDTLMWGLVSMVIVLWRRGTF
ncbi:uncharacterized protein LOC101856150 [Aplysia californica]|uniref:Uncharacterized protein LOC101856150 n=1 Tax=Aplysia californica TaxID=6500 RepID=A0ABM0KAB8_APLCA|nr:uncharacterized protein LOC101856150 [Aplysia californica]